MRRRPGHLGRPPNPGTSGIALVAVLLLLLLLMALATAAVLTSVTEIRTATSFLEGVRTLQAADAAASIALSGLRAETDWTAVLVGQSQGAWRVPVDMTPVLADGTRLDLVRETNRLRCRQDTTCTDSDLDRATRTRPWGPNNPRWCVYLSSPLRRWFPATSASWSRVHVVVWVGDDPGETDGWPEQDGQRWGAGRLLQRARAYASGGVSRTVELVLAVGSHDCDRGLTEVYPRVWRGVWH